MRQEIILDLDGVLIDFVRAAFKYWGVYDYEYPVHCGWDITAALNYLRDDQYTATPSQFWGSFDHRWWANLPWFPSAKNFYQLLVDSGADITICTSATLHPACASGKLEWINREMPELKRKYFIGCEKFKLAAPNRVLIDDADHNVEAWIKAGGDAILVPRPWNANHAFSGCSYGYTIKALYSLGVL